MTLSTILLASTLPSHALELRYPTRWMQTLNIQAPLSARVTIFD